jgi:hypothetical protein
MRLRVARVAAAGALLASAAGGASCASNRADTPRRPFILPIFAPWSDRAEPAPDVSDYLPTPEGPVLVASGDWDDVPASIDAALTPSGLAVERVIESTSERYFATLLTPSGEPGEVEARRAAPRGTPDPVTIHLRAHIGRVGDVPAQDRLLRNIRLRLAQLRGVGVAPLPSGW